MLALEPLMTQAECAKRLGISRTRVSQLERGAFNKLLQGLGQPERMVYVSPTNQREGKRLRARRRRARQKAARLALAERSAIRRQNKNRQAREWRARQKAKGERL